MPCNSPNKVFYTGINPETGKKKILYTSRFVDYIWRRSPVDRWQLGTIQESSTQTHGTKNEAVYKEVLSNLKPPAGGQLIIDSDLVPCGQCIGCRLDYARQWATRCMLEVKQYPKNSCWFVTFTYDDDHLPEYGRDVQVTDPDTGKKSWQHIQDEIVNPITGEYKHPPLRSVSKYEHQKLMKRIRKHYGNDIRFFMSGEYGEKSFRPHYHYLLFGVQFDDLVLYKSNFRGDPMYNSDSLVKNVWSKDAEGRWSDGSDGREVTPVGYVVVAPVTFDTANYVARYTLKKAKSLSKEAYEELGIEPEFCLMSRRPGLGKEYFEDNYEYIYECDEINLPGFDGSITVKPPAYFDTLLDKLDPESAADVKSKRRNISELAADTLAYRNPGLDLEDVYSASSRRLENKVIFKKKGEI